MLETFIAWSNPQHILLAMMWFGPAFLVIHSIAFGVWSLALKTVFALERLMLGED